MDRGRLDPGAAELLGQPVGAVLGAHEEQRAGRAGGDLGGDGHLVLGRETVKTRWSIAVDRRGGRRDRVHGRVGAGTSRTSESTPAVEGGREQQPLAAVRGRVQNLP